MWDSMFYVDDPRNGPLADEYGIVMGTSHTEPLARATKEQSRSARPWDWVNNRNTVQNFMREGVNRARNWETLWTLGMRGDHDTAGANLNAQRLTEIINFQQSTLRTVLGKSNLNDVPMMWCLYKVSTLEHISSGR